MFKRVHYQILAVACGVIAINAALAEEPAKPAESSKKPAIVDNDDCLSYEPGVVMLKGKLHHLVTNWALELDKPICINPRENAAEIYPQMDDVKTITFQKMDSDKLDKYRNLIDKSVVATGTLHHNFGPDKGNIII
jgi:hypothetical protein